MWVIQFDCKVSRIREKGNGVKPRQIRNVTFTKGHKIQNTMKGIKAGWKGFLMDILKVAIGITVGLAVDNWKKEKEQVSSELLILDKVENDLLVTLESCDTFMAKEQLALKSAERFIRQLDSTMIIRNDNMHWIYYNQFNPSASSIDVLKSMNNIGEFNNSSLIFDVISLSTTIDHMSEMSSTYTEFIQQFIDPIIVKHVDFNGATSPDSKVLIDMSNALAKTELRQIVKNQVPYMRTHLLRFSEWRKELMKVYTEVEREIVLLKAS